MPASRTQPPEPESQESGFSEAQRSELRDLIAEAVGSAKPPNAPEAPAGPKKLTDTEWDAMGDRQRESWVRSLVDFRLDELAKDDEIRAQREDIERLKADKTPEPEKPPSVITRIQKFMWGDPEDK